MFNINQKGLRYHISPIEEATRIYEPEDMIPGRKHKSERSALNSAALEK